MNADPRGSTALQERKMLEAILDSDGKSWASLSSELPAERALRIMAIATSAVVFRKWPNDPSLQEIASYVAEIAGRFPVGLPVAPVIIESVIRGVLGEPELLQGTPGREIVLAELLIVKSMQDEVLLSSADRDAYITEVLEAAD
jgi:hypothetical protein